MTRDEFSRILTLISGYWPHSTKAWTPDAVQMWESLLLDLDVLHVAATVQALSASEFAPPPGTIRKRCQQLTNPLPTADEAWKEVRDQVREIGWSKYGQVDFHSGEKCKPEWSHPLIERIAKSLGWQELCESRNEMADRAHFMRMWAEGSQRQETLDHLPPASRAALEAKSVALPDLSLPKELT